MRNAQKGLNRSNRKQSRQTTDPIEIPSRKAASLRHQADHAKETPRETGDKK